MNRHSARSTPSQPVRKWHATLAALLTFAWFTVSGADALRAGPCDAQATASRLVQSQRVLVIAHRGNSSVAPENTLPAFASAVAAGADLVELDYHHSSDGVPVVIHDSTVERTSDAKALWGNGHTSVASKNLSELRQLDMGTWFDPTFAAAQLPTLAEAVDVIQRGSMTLVERKAGDAATCVEFLRRTGRLDQLVVQAFDWQFVADCHRLAPSLVLGALGGRDLTKEKLDEMEATGARLVVWHKDSLSEEAIRSIHDRGLRAWAFTVNDLERARQLIRDGIDGIITNVPGAVRDVVSELEETAASRPDLTHPAASCTMTRGPRFCLPQRRVGFRRTPRAAGSRSLGRSRTR